MLISESIASRMFFLPLFDDLELESRDLICKLINFAI